MKVPCTLDEAIGEVYAIFANEVYIRNKEFVLTVKSVGVESMLDRRLENATLQILVC